MIVTPELVRAEMNYRVERAHGAAAPRLERVGRRAHRAWFRHGGDREDERPTIRNGAPRVA
jgi:hypothetical protein